MGNISTSLLRWASMYQHIPEGIALDDFALMPAPPEITRKIAEGLNSGDPSDRRISLLFCEGFLKQGRLVELDRNLFETLPREVVRLVNDRDALTRSAAHVLLVALRETVPEYQAIMYKALLDNDAQVRTVALNAVNTFSEKGSVDMLLSFEFDTYISEVGGMDGAVHYVLRDQALSIIEGRLCREFEKYELTEIRDGMTVFWWDWRPMLQWYRESRTGIWSKVANRLRRNK